MYPILQISVLIVTSVFNYINNPKDVFVFHYVSNSREKENDYSVNLTDATAQPHE